VIKGDVAVNGLRLEDCKADTGLKVAVQKDLAQAAKTQKANVKTTCVGATRRALLVAALPDTLVDSVVIEFTIACGKKCNSKQTSLNALKDDLAQLLANTITYGNERYKDFEPQQFQSDIKQVPSVTESPTAGPTLSGDPHLVGLRGQKFDLIGKPNTKYLLIGDDHFQINVITNYPFFAHSADDRLRAADNHAGVFMTEVETAFIDSDGVVYELSIKGDYNSTVRHDRSYCVGGNVA